MKAAYVLIASVLLFSAVAQARTTTLPPGLRNAKGLSEFLDLSNPCGACAWKCEEPACPGPICKPVCQAPKCDVRCQDPEPPKCETKCDAPVCKVQCADICTNEHKAANNGTCPPPKDHTCHVAGANAGGCPPCHPTCDPPVCNVHCEQPKPKCQTMCEDLDCQWSCENPQCAQPVCKLHCDDPNLKCHKKPCCGCDANGAKPAATTPAVAPANTIAPALAPAFPTPRTTAPAAPQTQAKVPAGLMMMRFMENKMNQEATKCCNC